MYVYFHDSLFLAVGKCTFFAVLMAPAGRGSVTDSVVPVWEKELFPLPLNLEGRGRTGEGGDCFESWTSPAF